MFWGFSLGSVPLFLKLLFLIHVCFLVIQKRFQFKQHNPTRKQTILFYTKPMPSCKTFQITKVIVNFQAVHG